MKGNNWILGQKANSRADKHQFRERKIQGKKANLGKRLRVNKGKLKMALFSANK